MSGSSPVTSENKHSGRELVRGTVIISILTQISRVLGFVREALTARLLGDGFYSDAYFVAARIPNLLRAIFAEGALTSAFVPLFAGALEKDRAEAQRALSLVTGFLLLATLATTILGCVYTSNIVLFFAPGFSAEKLAYCASLTRIMLPFIILVSIVAMLNGALNSVKIFGTAAWAQVIINIALIIGAAIGFSLEQNGVAQVLSWSVLVGGILGIVCQIPALSRAGFSLRPIVSLGDPYIRSLLKLMLPAIFGAALYQLTLFISGVFASLLAEGSVSWLYYADRIAQLPIGVFTVALGSVLLPSLSRLHARGATEDFHKSLSDALRYTSFLMVPIATGLFYFAQPLVILFLEGGKFSRASSEQAALALKAFSIGLWAVSCHSLAIKAFLARKDTLTPTLLSAASLVASVVLSLLFMGPPISAHADVTQHLVTTGQQFFFTYLPHWSMGHVGLALSSSISACGAFVMLGALLTVRLRFTSWLPMILAGAKGLVASALALGVIEFFRISFGSPLLELAVGGSIFIALFGVFSTLLQCQELSETARLVWSKFSSKKIR